MRSDGRAPDPIEPATASRPIARPWLARAFPAAVALLLVGVVSGCKDGSGITDAAVPTVEIVPRKFVFPKLGVGQSEDREVRLRNVGGSKLILARIDPRFDTNFELFYVPSTDASGNQRVGVDRSGQNLLPGTLEIEPDEWITFVISYSPTGEGTPAGSLRMESNDPDNKTITIPIETVQGGPQIDVNPRAIDFGRVPAQMEFVENLRVTNIGAETLTFSSMPILGSTDFTLRVDGKDPNLDPSVASDPDGDGTPGLAAGAFFDIEVVYFTEADGSDSGEISFNTNDPDRPDFRVPLSANGSSPCIQVTPDSLQFPPSLIGRATARPVSFESCGTDSLEIQAIYITDDSSPTFRLDEASVPDLPALMPAMTPDEAPPTRTINVEFHPDAEQAYGGKLVIESNDPIHPRVEVPLTGRGAINECPVAAVAQETFAVLPLDVIELDGSASTDPDGPGGVPTGYEWVVVSRPDGSTQQPVESFRNFRRPQDGGPADDPSTPTAFFFVDLAGSYVFELRVTDNLGLSAPSEECPQVAATVSVEAVPGAEILVELTWQTPADPDETDDDGTDLDLHLLHPRGRAWSVAPWDCYFANTNPDWGPPGPDGNPSLDIDDVSGAGPENITVVRPEDTIELGGPYRIGVHYYRAENFLTGQSWGPSEARIRVYLSGVLAGEYSRILQATDHFWEVAGIIWSDADRRVQEINRYSNRIP